MKEPKYLQRITAANKIYEETNDLKPWFSAINNALNKWIKAAEIKKRRATDKEYQQKLCAVEKRTKERRVAAGKRAAETAYRRARKLQATPAWASKSDIERVYAIAKLTNEIASLEGDSYHVDHVIPLIAKHNHNGIRIASGLHIASNLEIIKAEHNLNKGCKHVI